MHRRFLPNQTFLPGYSSYHHDEVELTEFLQLQQEACTLFEKKFTLKSDYNEESKEWQLPDSGYFSSEIWTDDQLLALKDRLNQVKSQLTDLDLEKWHRHTHITNPALHIHSLFDYHGKPEILTRAFLKFYEILQEYPLISEAMERAGTCRSVHLCEAPGAFIVALNHHLAVNHPKIKWFWTANTLNPYYEGMASDECITDDRVIMETLDNWFFGSDLTGNLMAPKYLEELVEKFEKEKVDIVTGDGSIDCQSNPSEQEGSTEALQFCEVVCALQILKAGGSLVVKKFTFFECASVNVLYMICCLFRQVHAFKPVTSKLGNSEVYIVAMDYEPPESSTFFMEINKHYGQIRFEKSMFSKEELPVSFLQTIVNLSTFFSDHQILAIRNNIDLFVNSTRRKHQLQECLQLCVENHYKSKYAIFPISENRKMSEHRMCWNSELMPQMSICKGLSYLSRKSEGYRIKTLSGECETLQRFINRKVFKKKLHSNDHPYIIHQHVVTSCDQFKPVYGAPFETVNVTRFCNPRAFQVYQQILREFLPNKSDNILPEKSDYVQSEAIDRFAKLCSATRERIGQILPGAKIIENSHGLSCSSNCCDLYVAVDLVCKASVPPEGLVLINLPIFTRLQFGILLLLVACFKHVQYYFSADDNLFSFISLVDPLPEASRPQTQLELLNTLKASTSGQLLELYSVNDLISSSIYWSVCVSNYSYCLQRSKILVSILKDTVVKEMKTDPSY